ncbi:MAG: efflux RND transporter periplasmic adaptor subunit [Acidobacteria bacterium]|nr:efflux RND transporter periplasmic adaptor subunit [Acidobacteriota bacterium]
MKLKFSGKQILITIAVLAVAGTAGWFFWSKREASAEEYLTAKIERGDLRNSVFATGTLQAVTTVQVGSQVSGTIASLSADFNTKVHRGQVVAQLDPSILQAQVSSARANLEQAKASAADAQAKLLAAKANVQNLQAGVSSANANLSALKAQMDDAASLLKRQKALADAGIAAERDLESARTTYNAAEARYKQAVAQLEQARSSEQSSATAGVAQAEAQVKQTQAQVKQTEASLKLAEVNLSHTTIVSPIDGVVVSRNVDVGQTVAASFSAPVLFTIANDLTQMQVIANIDQADIGSINQENKVTFTVDAYTGRRFEGEIKEIRLSPQNVQNVVTYNVVINVQNPDQKLLPGMTANLTFAVAERKAVLKVPNAALRFSPKDMTPDKIREIMRSQRGGGQGGEQQAQSSEGAQQGAQAGQADGSGNRQGRRAQQGQGGQEGQQGQRSQQGQAGENGGGRRTGGGSGVPGEGQWRLVWVLGADNKPQPRRVKLGITDGTATEVMDGNLQEGETIIVGQKISGNGATTTSTRPPGFGGAPFGGGPAGGGRR